MGSSPARACKGLGCGGALRDGTQVDVGRWSIPPGNSASLRIKKVGAGGSILAGVVLLDRPELAHLGSCTKEELMLSELCTDSLLGGCT